MELLAERKMRRHALMKRDDVSSLFHSVYSPWYETQYKRDGMTLTIKEPSENYEQTRNWLGWEYKEYLKGIFVQLARERGANEVRIGDWYRQVTDASRKKTYDAESDFRKHVSGGWVDAVGARRFIKEILASDLWKKVRRTAPRPVSVRPESIVMEVIKTQKSLQVGDEKRMIAGISHRNKGRISIHEDHLNKVIILHELAHQAGYGNHGRGFRLIQVLLMAKFLGPKGVKIARIMHRQYLKRGLPVMLTDIPKPLSWSEWVDRHAKIWFSVLKKEWGKDHVEKAKERFAAARPKLALTEKEKEKLKKDMRASVTGTADGRELETSLGLD